MAKEKRQYTELQLFLIKLAETLIEKGLKVKQAIAHGRGIHYFKGEDFYTFLQEKKDEINEILKERPSIE